KVLKDNNPYKGAYVFSNISKNTVLTNENGEYSLDVKCNEDGYVYIYGYDYNKGLKFNVNGQIGFEYSETSDSGEESKLNDFSVSNREPYVYIYSYQQSVKPNKDIYIYAYAYDPDGDSVSYSWSDNNCGGQFDNATISSPKWTAPSIESKCKLTLTVKDSQGAQSEKSIEIDVYENRAPVISYLYASKNTVKKGESINIYSYAYDPDGDSVSYSWSDNNCGGQFDNATISSPKWTAPNKQAECSLSITVSDRDKSVSRSITIKVGFSPVINSINVPSTANVGDELEFKVDASDADGDNLTYSWKIGGSEICNTAQCKYKVQTTGTITVDVEVRDTDGNTAKASRTINVGKGANTEIRVQSRN
ncbi:MAG: PKD domain-containing protein, partial [Candidatus Anstonellales archaeon]